SAFSKGGKRNARRAERTWAFLAFQSLATVDGEEGFFVDCQSMLFLLAIDHLLPALEKDGLAAERDCLVNALLMHLHLCDFVHDLAHWNYLLSQFADALNLTELRERALFASVATTPVTD